MSKKSLKIILMQDQNYYFFAEITYSSDGTAILAFPYIPESRGITQRLQLLKEDSSSNEFTPNIMMSNFESETCHNEKFRISYHTTGQVNYHGSSFDPLLLEPLHSITKQNLFLIFSFELLTKFQSVSSSEFEQNSHIVIDISQLFGTRIDICFSIVPASFVISDLDYTSFLIAHAHVYQILVELFQDTNTFNFCEIYSPNDCVHIRPPSNEKPKYSISQSDACLQYKHILYKTNDIIVLPPNSDNRIEVIFPTVMRIPPWIKIKFQNPDHEIKCVERHDWRLFFKVYDKKRSRYVNNAQEIIIEGFALDAEIYDDNESPPEGFI